MVTSVYHTISTGKQIFIQAPTGVGKPCRRFFRLCGAWEKERRNHFLSYSENHHQNGSGGGFFHSEGTGLLFKVVTITAKEKLCICEKPECNPDSCPYAKPF